MRESAAPPGSDSRLPVARVDVTAFTHCGAVRPGNQDAAGAGSAGIGAWLAAESGAPSTLRISSLPAMIVVADGAGGHPAGDVASRIAVTVLLEHGTRIRTAQDLGDAFLAAHAALQARMATDPGTVGMTTTAAALVVTERSVLIGHVGDSRIYELGHDELLALTDDDRASPGGTVLTQGLGGPLGHAAPTPHLDRLAVESQLRFLLCTDGVTERLDELTLDTLRRERRGDFELAQSLLDGALERGAPDNVTAVVSTVSVARGETLR